MVLGDPKWTVDWKVTINGRDLTSAWAPVLIDIDVTDQDGTASDSCSLTVDDSEGQISLPRKGDRLVVHLDGGKVFEGFIDRPKSSGSRSAGMLLKIQAKGFDADGKVKEPQSFHQDDASLQDFLGAAAERAGLSLKIDPAFGSIMRDYWSAEAESFLDLGERLARKLGGTFKIRGDTAVLARRGNAPAGIVTGIRGKNLIDWDITPRDPRPGFAAGRAKWFDRRSAEFKTQELDFGIEGARAENVVRTVLADKAEAGEINDTHKRNGERESGGGSVTLDIAVAAAAEAQFQLIGVRAGIDGLYRIASVKHKANRSGGSTTSLDIKEPGGGAGTDNRRPGEPADTGFALPAHETLG